MTGTDLCVNMPHKSRSYLNHLVIFTAPNIDTTEDWVILLWTIIIIKSHYSLWSIGHPRRASRYCDLQLSLWPRSMIFLCFLFEPLFSFATFSSAYLFFCIPDDSSLMRFSLLLLFLFVMCVSNPNAIFLFLFEFLLTSVWWFSIVLL